MGITKIKLKRSFSNGNANVSSALQTGNMTLSYGEPLWFQNNFYTNAKLFVGDDNNNPFFIGPYYAGDGIVINTDNTSATLGQISMEYPIPSLTGNGGKTLRANSSGTALVWGDTLTMRTMNGEQLTDSSLGDINIHDGFYFPNAVQDYDGNWYGAVVIGNQVWLGENLRTTHYADGTAITKGDPSTYMYNTALYYDNENSSIPLRKRGYYYTFPAVMNGAATSSLNPSGVQGISPNGWHMPSDAEWMTMYNYLNKQQRYTDAIAKSIASTYGWSTTNVSNTPGKNPELNNSTNFGAIPLGNHSASGSGAGFYEEENVAYFWTTKFSNYNICTYIFVAYGVKQIQIATQPNYVGCSVRCVSDLTPVQFRNWYIEQYGSLQHHLPEEVQEQADWSQSDNTKVDFIKNKPTNVSSFTNDAGYITSSDVQKDVFLCKYTYGSSVNGVQSVTVDKSASEIVTAFSEGKIVICRDNSHNVLEYQCIYASLSSILFSRVSTTHGGRYEYISYDGTSWTCSFFDIQERMNISAVNGASLLNGGNITVPGTLFYGMTSTAEATPEKVVTLLSPSTSFANGCYLLLHFSYGVPAGNSNTININGDSYMLTYHQYNVSQAGVINAGDKVLMICINSVAHIIAIDRWGADITSKQDMLVSGTNIKTINNESLIGSGDVHISGDILMITATPYNDNWKLPKTPDELISLYSNGVTVVVNVGGRLFYRQVYDDPTFFSTNGLDQIERLFYYQGTEDGVDTVWYVSSTVLQRQLTSGTNIKTINGNSLLGNGNIDAQDTLVCTFTGTDNITCDKTVAEMFEAWQNKKIVVGLMSTTYYYLQYVNEIGFATFFKLRSSNGVTIDMLLTTDNGSSWVKTNSAVQEKLVSGTSIKTVNGTSILGSGNIAIDQDYERVMTLSADTDMSTILNNTACNNANLLLKISADTVIDMDTYANHETYVVVQNTDSNAHTIKFDYSDGSIAAFIGSGEYIAGNNALQVTVPANAHVMISMRVMDGDAVLFKVDRVRLHMNPVTEAELSDDDVAIVLLDNNTGTLKYITVDDLQQYNPDLSGYTIKPFVRFTRGKNGKSVVMHKTAISGQWALNNYYKVYCDTTAAGGFTITVGNWGTSTSATVSWSSGATLDSIVAQMTNGTYCWFSHESEEDFIRVSAYTQSSSHTCTLTNNTGGTVEDLSKYCRINGVVQSEVHRVWQGIDVSSLFPSFGFLPANTAQYAKNGYNMSYICGANLARYKAYYGANGASSYVAESSIAARMTAAAFAALNNSGVAEQQALYDKYNGSWDAYMDASMIQIDDMHTGGIEYQSYDNGEQSKLLASVETKDFTGNWVPAYPAAYNAAQLVDANIGACNLPTNHEIAVFMEDSKFAKINAAMSYIGGSALSNTAYYWSVAQCYSYNAWLYTGNNGRLRSNGKYSTYSVRALAYLS